MVPGRKHYGAACVLCMDKNCPENQMIYIFSNMAFFLFRKFRNIALVGTDHVAGESTRRVNAAFGEISPDIVAVELDRNRLYALKNKVRRPKNLELIKAFGLGGFIFYVIGEFVQKKIGKIVNIEPGSEMLAALKLAEKSKADIALIDRDISITMK